MDFIKKHYEKVLLGLVLVGLVVAAVFLLIMVSAERDSLEEARNNILKRPVKPLKELDLSHAEAVLANLQSPRSLDFSSTNKLFNPVRWKRTADGQLRKEQSGSEIEKQVEIARITQLYLRITLDDVRPSDSGTRYGIGIQQETAASPIQRRKRPAVYASKDDKKDAFTLSDVKGPADDPEVILTLSDSGEHISISKDKPFTRVDGHAADLNFGPEKRSFPNKRYVGIGTLAETTVSFGGVPYKIVAIGANEVILSAPSEKKYTIKLNAASETR
jgi:hypothetical protein